MIRASPVESKAPSPKSNRLAVAGVAALLITGLNAVTLGAQTRPRPETNVILGAELGSGRQDDPCFKPHGPAFGAFAGLAVGERAEILLSAATRELLCKPVILDSPPPREIERWTHLDLVIHVLFPVGLVRPYIGGG